MNVIENHNQTGISFDGACSDLSIDKALDAIGGKWSFLVLRELLGSPKRFGVLRRAIRGVSPKSLAATLHHLETYDILTRTVYPTTPPVVEYALTPKGGALRPILQAMKQWGQS